MPHRAIILEVVAAAAKEVVVAVKTEGWRARYDAFMSDATSHPFAWFEHDCVTFAAKVLDLQYDLGLMAVIATNYAYTGQASAIAMIEKHGGLEALVTEVLGAEPLPPAWLTVGDAVLYAYDQPEFPYALAVHDGHNLLIPGEKGLTYLRMDRALKGWRP
jgi:hypothetical protein